MTVGAKGGGDGRRDVDAKVDQLLSSRISELPIPVHKLY